MKHDKIKGSHTLGRKYLQNINDKGTLSKIYKDSQNSIIEQKKCTNHFNRHFTKEDIRMPKNT